MNEEKEKKTVAVFFADGFEMIEALTPVDYLRRCGVNVLMVSVPSDEMQEPYTVKSSGGVTIKTDITLFNYLEKYAKADASLPDAVICPGGGGSQNLASCEVLLSHLEKCYDKNKIVAAICASPAVVLGKTKILKGKKWTCFPGMKDCAKDEILSSSSHMDSGACNGDNGDNGVRVVVDGNVVTAAAAGCSEEFAFVLCELLAGKTEADRVAKSCLVR